MKKLTTILILASILVLPLVAHAQGNAVDKIMGILKNIVNIMRSVLILVGILFLVIAGFYFIFARGDDSKLTTARSMLLWSLIGIGVGVIAPALVDFVVGLVGVGPLN